MSPLLGSALLSLCIGLALPAFANDESKTTPSKHQLMKECMAKEKASDAGMPKEDMKQTCRDVTDTEHENERVEKAAEKEAEHTADPPRS